MFIERKNAGTTVKVMAHAEPKIIIFPEALNKMSVFVKECSDEIGWLGTAIREGEYIFIQDVFLFDQEVHATTTEITPDGLSSFAEELLQRPDGVEIWNNMRVWGHSHVNMGVSPSGQDDTQMNTFKEGGHPWFIRLIANKKGDLKLDFYDYANGIIFTDVKWARAKSETERAIQEQIDALNKQLEEAKQTQISMVEEPIKEEMKVKVRKKTFTHNRPLGQSTFGKPTTMKTFPSITKKHGDNYYEKDDEVLEDFDFISLQYIAYCDTLEEVEEELHKEGWGHAGFTPNDLERIYRVALKRCPWVQYQGRGER